MKEIRAPSTMSIISIIVIVTYCYINMFQPQLPAAQNMSSPVMLILGYYFGSAVNNNNNNNNNTNPKK